MDVKEGLQSCITSSFKELNQYLAELQCMEGTTNPAIQWYRINDIGVAIGDAEVLWRQYMEDAM